MKIAKISCIFHKNYPNFYVTMNFSCDLKSLIYLLLFLLYLFIILIYYINGKNIYIFIYLYMYTLRREILLLPRCVCYNVEYIR